MKVLNLYAGLGGNRELWPCSAAVTAIENNKCIAEIYSEKFPKDEVIVGDAHAYLLGNFKNYDFIWSSPPCQTHSKLGLFHDPRYVDMTLYQEIILLENWYDGNWCVENVDPYYAKLKPAWKLGRHLIWSNMYIPEIVLDERKIHHKTLEDYGYRGRKLPGPHPEKWVRNMVDPKIGKVCYEQAQMDIAGLSTGVIGGV
jgi:DNA (cytosine-5)-methyltransferase 1